MSNYKIKNTDYSKLDKNIKIVIISSEFNRNYTKKLEDINEKKLEENNFKNIKKFIVPWAFEIPAFLEKIIHKQKPDLVLCFWVVIRWETTHYEMVANESARGIMNISISHKDVAIINWILTCENNSQVEERLENNYAISWLNLINEIKNI